MSKELTVLRWRWHIHTNGSAWPHFKGFAIHSALGPALHSANPQAYASLYGENSTETDIKPYRLLPPLSSEQYFSKNTPLNIDFALFGTHSCWLMDCMSAMEKVGNMGVKHEKAGFTIVSIVIG